MSFKPSNTTGRGVVDPRPGPGDYILPSTMPVPKKNRKNNMISTAKRDGVAAGTLGTAGPGPGSYNVGQPLIRKSHNILLAPEY